MPVARTRSHITLRMQPGKGRKKCSKHHFVKAARKVLPRWGVVSSWCANHFQRSQGSHYTRCDAALEINPSTHRSPTGKRRGWPGTPGFGVRPPYARHEVTLSTPYSCTVFVRSKIEERDRMSYGILARGLGPFYVSLCFSTPINTAINILCTIWSTAGYETEVQVAADVYE